MPVETLAVVASLAALAAVALCAVLLVRLRRAGATPGASGPASRAGEVSAMLERQFAQSREVQQVELSQASDAVAKLADQMAQLRAETARGLDSVRAENAASLERVRVENARSLERVRTESAEGVEAVRTTVGEKLERALGEQLSRSFARVDKSLEQVNRGLGEMQGLAQGVGDLRRVLSNVKTRGILGEVQLGAILREVLAPGQYAENVATVPGSSERVEYAVRIPGDDGGAVWLPIDAKFPGDAYEHLRAAEELGDAAAVEAAWRALEARLRAEAKDIHDKYLAPPATTSFGIMFLPFEGLYAEVAGRPGLLERLQRESRVSVAGPSTMAAVLNALEMSFQAVAIQRRADEIQRVLVDVRTEFAKYQGELEKAQRQLATASRTIDGLATTRARAMERRLARVTELGEPDADLAPASGVGPEAGAAPAAGVGEGAAVNGGAPAASDGPRGAHFRG